MTSYAADLAPVLAGFRPPPLLTVSEWADTKRILTTGAEPGPYRSSRTPYMRGPMDAVLDPAVRIIAFEKSHQVGASAGIDNVIGYHMEHDRCGMLLAEPTIEIAEAYAKNDLGAMIAACPSLAALVPGGRGPNAESTLRLKIYPNGFLALAGANSPASFRRWTVRMFIGDDVDGWPAALEDEGDPVELGINRTTTFWNKKILLVSTPTLKGGRIDTWYHRSDQRRFFVPCPRCGRMDWLTFSNAMHFRVVFENRDHRTAQLACPSPEDTDGCGGRIDEDERETMVAAGEWRPTAVSKEPGLIGFHIWAGYSPWESLSSIVAKFLAARERGRESVRVFVNTTLGEGFEDTTQRVEPMPLLNRREVYEPGPDTEVPAGAACLVAGVDTQDNRYELLVLAIGPGEQTWVVDWRQIMGDPHDPNTAAALHTALFDRKYRHALGVDLPIHAVAIDSAGHRTDDVYAFVAAHAARYCYAIIGRAGLTGKPIAHKSAATETRLVDLYTINVDDAKARILSDLALAAPGPGYWHLPQGVDTIDEAFVNQLTAEQQVTRRNRKSGVVYQSWVQIRAENHALDCAVYALGALRIRRPNPSQMLASLRAMVGPLPPSAPETIAARAVPPPSPAPAPPVRRVSRSAYLGG